MAAFVGRRAEAEAEGEAVRAGDAVRVLLLAGAGVGVSAAHRHAAAAVPLASGLAPACALLCQAAACRMAAPRGPAPPRVVVRLQALLYAAAVALAGPAVRTSGVAMHQAMTATAGLVFACVLDGRAPPTHAAVAAAVASAVAFARRRHHEPATPIAGAALSLGQAACFAAVGALHRNKQLRDLPRAVVVASMTAHAAAYAAVYVVFAMVPRWEAWPGAPLLRSGGLASLALLLANGAAAAVHTNLSATVARSRAGAAGVGLANALKTLACVLLSP